MSPLLLTVCLAVGALIVAGLVRAWRGPTVFDRLLAVAFVTVNGVIVLVVLGFLIGPTAFFLDIAIAYALLAFLLPVTIGRYFQAEEDRTTGGRRDAGSDPEPDPHDDDGEVSP